MPPRKRLYTCFAVVGLASVGIVSTVGTYGNSTGDQFGDRVEVRKHFAKLPISYDADMAIASGDYDGDGDLDFIVAGEGKLFYFENDGEANFTLRVPER